MPNGTSEKHFVVTGQLRAFERVDEAALRTRMADIERELGLTVHIYSASSYESPSPGARS